MPIENTIYSRLTSTTALTSAVGSRIYPTIPAENLPALPFAVYRITDTEPQLTTQGVSSLTKYTLEVDSYATTVAVQAAVQAAVRAALHGYRSAGIQGSFLTGQSTEEIVEGFHTKQSFTIWGDN